MLRTIKAECVGSTVYSLETYLVIDNATESDAGTYVVNATIQQHTFLPVTKKVKVVVGRFLISCIIHVLFNIV